MAKISGKNKKWFYVIMGMVMFICLGTVYSWSVFRTPLEQQYGIDVTQSGLPYLVFLLSYTVAMILTGKLIDRVKPKIMILIGGIMVGLGWILSGIVTSFPMIVLTYGFIAGTGVGVVYGPPIKVISSWFTKSKGIAIGLLLGGFGLSPLLTAPVSKALINAMGINGAFIVIGIFFLIIIPVLGWQFERSETEDSGDGSVPRDKSEAEQSCLLETIKTRRFIGLWICYIIGTTVGLMVIGISGQIGQEMFGISANQAAYLISFFAVFNAVGRPLFGWITDKFSPYVSATFSFGLIILAACLLFFLSSCGLVIYVLSLVILWMNLGAWLSIAPTSVALYFGEENYSRNYGMLFSAYGIGAVVGTPLASFIKTQFGSYQYISLPIIALSIIGIAVALTTLRMKRSNKV